MISPTQPPLITLTQEIYEASLHPALLALRQGNYLVLTNKNEPDTYNQPLADSLLNRCDAYRTSY